MNVVECSKWLPQNILQPSSGSALVISVPTAVCPQVIRFSQTFHKTRLCWVSGVKICRMQSILGSFPVLQNSIRIPVNRSSAAWKRIIRWLRGEKAHCLSKTILGISLLWWAVGKNKWKRKKREVVRRGGQGEFNCQRSGRCGRQGPFYQKWQRHEDLKGLRTCY